MMIAVHHFCFQTFGIIFKFTGRQLWNMHSLPSCSRRSYSTANEQGKNRTAKGFFLKTHKKKKAFEQGTKGIYFCSFPQACELSTLDHTCWAAFKDDTKKKKLSYSKEPLHQGKPMNTRTNARTQSFRHLSKIMSWCIWEKKKKKA